MAEGRRNIRAFRRIMTDRRGPASGRSSRPFSRKDYTPMRLHLLIVVGLLLSLGCGSASFAPRAAKEGSDQSRKPAAAGERGPAQDGEAPASRKIIYTARAELIVEDFDQGQKALLQLVEQHKGYVASSEVSGAPGTRRFGTWTVRVPE